MSVLSHSISERDDSQTTHSGVSHWVVRSIVIGIVLFIMLFVALHLYCTCKPRTPSEAPPLFAEPRRLYDPLSIPVTASTERDLNKKLRKWIPLRRTPTSSSLDVPLIPRDSRTQIPLADIPLPARIHVTKSKLTLPTAGIRPNIGSLSVA